MRPISCSRPHLLLAGHLRGVPGNQPHDIIVINDGGCKEHKFKIQFLYLRAGFVIAFPLLVFQALGGFQIDAPEGVQALVFGQNLFDRPRCISFGEIGVLVELRFKALDFLEMVDESAACVVALEIGNFFGFACRGPAIS